MQVELVHKRSNVDVGNVESLLYEKSAPLLRQSHQHYDPKSKNAFGKLDKKGELFRSNSSSNLKKEMKEANEKFQGPQTERVDSKTKPRFDRNNTISSPLLGKEDIENDKRITRRIFIDDQNEISIQNPNLSTDDSDD